MTTASRLLVDFRLVVGPGRSAASLRTMSVASLWSSSAPDRKPRTIVGYDEQELGANVGLRSFCTES